MNKSLELFYQFLEANGALIAWEQNFTASEAKLAEPKSRAEFFSELIAYEPNWIMSAFLWFNTPQGHQYWQQLDRNWRIHLIQNI